MNAGATVDKLPPVDVINGFMIRETQLRRSLHGKVKDYLVIVGWSFEELSQVALRQVIVKLWDYLTWFWWVMSSVNILILTNLGHFTEFLRIAPYNPIILELFHQKSLVHPVISTNVDFFLNGSFHRKGHFVETAISSNGPSNEKIKLILCNNQNHGMRFLNILCAIWQNRVQFIKKSISPKCPFRQKGIFFGQCY